MIQTDLHKVPTLAVDDKVTTCELFKGTLSAAGSTCGLATNIAEARELLDQGPYGLVIADTWVEAMDGIGC